MGRNCERIFEKIENRKRGRNLKKNLKTFLVFGLGLLFLCYGVMRGEVEIMWIKAINICLECIGIG